MYISIPESVLSVMSRLEERGYETWCVGGCVRDSLRGAAPADWDIASSALPEEVLACFPGLSAVETGRRHGTIGLVLENQVVEVTTFRRDGPYLRHRRPESVAFSQRIEEDLARRDFTVNAMAYHPARGLCDPFDGEEDLRACVLRCVGDPVRRFNEDALRILRCLRFAATLGFSLHPGTRSAAYACRNLLAAVSSERIREELSKLLPGQSVRAVMEKNPSVFFAVLPELEPLYRCPQETLYHCYDCWGHSLHALEASPREPVLRWAALLHDCGKPACKSFDSHGRAHFYGHVQRSAQLAGEILSRLHFSKQESSAIVQLIQLHGERLPMCEKRLKKLLAVLEESGLFQLLALIRADVLAQAPGLAPERLPLISQAEEAARAILGRRECLSRKDLALDGKDLLALGFAPSRKLGQALDSLLEAVLAGELANEKPALLARAKEWLLSEP